MAAPNLPLPNGDLDYLLAQVARALQLTPTQHQLAVEHYEGVAKWLGSDGSPLRPCAPSIYPQGSMALETTVRPRSRDEYDLDLVCQVRPTGMSALALYNAVYERLKAHGTYAPMLEKKNRCVRLNYAHDFHLDIIAAEPDGRVGGTAIRVPDRTLQDWTPSNPRGYVAWFTNRSRITLAELRKNVDPVPTPTPADEKPALTIAVQLIKRRRDMVCDEETAPRSVVLTTLAAECYQGTDCVLTAMMQIVAGIQARIRAAGQGRITVCNPTNSGEKFCESFNGPGRYDAFKSFITRLEVDLARIANTQGIHQLQQLLASTFGEEPVEKAVRSYGEMQKALRDANSLTFSGAAVGGGLAIVTPSSGITRTVPPNRYYGGASGE